MILLTSTAKPSRDAHRVKEEDHSLCYSVDAVTSETEASVQQDC